MAVSYKKLFKLLIDEGMKKRELCAKAGISPTTLSKMSNDANVSMDVVDRICVALKCTPNDIMEIQQDTSISPGAHVLSGNNKEIIIDEGADKRKAR